MFVVLIFYKGNYYFNYIPYLYNSISCKHIFYNNHVHTRTVYNTSRDITRLWHFYTYLHGVCHDHTNYWLDSFVIALHDLMPIPKLSRQYRNITFKSASVSNDLQIYVFRIPGFGTMYVKISGKRVWKDIGLILFYSFWQASFSPSMSFSV